MGGFGRQRDGVVLGCPEDLSTQEKETRHQQKQKSANAAKHHLLVPHQQSSALNQKRGVPKRGRLQTVTHWVQADGLHSKTSGRSCGPLYDYTNARKKEESNVPSC